MQARILGLLILSNWMPVFSVPTKPKSPLVEHTKPKSLLVEYTKPPHILRFPLGKISIPSEIQPFGSVEIKKGDQLFTAAFPLGSRKLKAPYHVSLAVNESHLLQIRMEPLFALRYVKPTILPATEMWSDLRTRRIPYNQLGFAIGIEKTLSLARRINGVVLPYNLLTCNCRHYADYLTYGKTFGERWKWSYWAMSDRCPLYARIDEHTVVSSSNFVFRDKHNNTYHLNDDPSVWNYVQRKAQVLWRGTKRGVAAVTKQVKKPFKKKKPQERPWADSVDVPTPVSSVSQTSTVKKG